MSNDLEFISIDELLNDTLVLKDILSAQENIQELEIPDIAAQIPDSVDSIESINQLSPTEAQEPTQRQGFTEAKTTKHAPMALHYAAKNACIAEIKHLVEEQGYDVNAEDHLSLRPLYIAAQHGNKAAVQYFIAKGADVHDLGYEKETALHVAIEKGNYAIARILVEKGEAEIDTLNANKQTATNMLISQYMAILDKGSKKIHKAESIETMMEIIKTLEVFSKHCGPHFLYSTHVADNLTVDIPISHYLDLFASRAPTVEMRDTLISLSQAVCAVDPSGNIYEHAKNILNTFPNNNTYTLDLGNGKTTYLTGKGHFGCLTTKWANDSLHAFEKHLAQFSSDKLKNEVFSKLAQTFESATELKLHGELESYAQKAFERYENGETILIATGWNSHFIDVVLSKKLGLFITGNSGDRCEEIKPGLNFYHMNDPNKISAKFMHDMTVNLDKSKFERDFMYEYELLEKKDEKVSTPQEFSNCTWVGHQHGIEACLEIELRKLGLSKEQAGPLASKYYGEWEDFHGFYQIDTYMKNSPGLSFNALTDMFMDLSKKLSAGNIGAKLALHGKFCQALSSEHYLADFKEWLKQPENKAAKNRFEPFLEHHKDFDSVYHGDFVSKVSQTFKHFLFGDESAKMNKSPVTSETAQDDAPTNHPAPSTNVVNDTQTAMIAHHHDPIPHHEQPVVLVS